MVNLSSIRPSQQQLAWHDLQYLHWTSSVPLSALRFRITDFDGTPSLRSMALHDVPETE